MARTTDGRRFWPQLAPHIWSKYGGVEEVQFVQDDLDHIELRIVAQQLLDATQERGLTDEVGQAHSLRRHHSAARQRQVRTLHLPCVGVCPRCRVELDERVVLVAFQLVLRAEEQKIKQAVLACELVFFRRRQ